jgi:hypothetical protein
MTRLKPRGPAIFLATKNANNGLKLVQLQITNEACQNVDAHECPVRRIAPAAVMVDKYFETTLNTNKTQVLAR